MSKKPDDKEIARRNDILLPGDLKGVDIIKHVEHPEAYLLRRSYINQARAGEYPKTDCPHPVSGVEQFWDDVRDHEVNLMKCKVCGSALWLIDPHGRAASDD